MSTATTNENEISKKNPYLLHRSPSDAQNTQLKLGVAFSYLGFVTIDPPRDSDKLRILLQGFVWETYVSDMKIVHKIRSERF